MSGTRSPECVEFLREVTGDDEAVGNVVSTFPTWDAVVAAGIAGVMRCGVNGQAAAQIVATPSPPRLDPHLGKVVTKYSMAYPAGVRDLPSPPVALHVQGTLPEGPVLLIAGSTMPSPVGVEVSRAAAKLASEAGVACLWVGEEGVGMSVGLEIDPRLSVMLIPHGVLIPSHLGYAMQATLDGGGAVVSAVSKDTRTSTQSTALTYTVAAAWSEAVLLPEFSVLPSGALTAARVAVSLDRTIIVPERVHDSVEKPLTSHMTVAGTDTLSTPGTLDSELYPAGSRAHARGAQGLPPADYVVTSTRQLREVLDTVFDSDVTWLNEDTP